MPAHMVSNNVTHGLIVKSPPFQSNRAQGITPSPLAVGDERNGLYSSTIQPDLYPITSGTRPYLERQLRLAGWGSIELLPDSNSEFVDEFMVSARELRRVHSGPGGFATDWQYSPQPPFPLWTRHLPCPAFPDFDTQLLLLDDMLVVGGFAFLDTHSFWAIYGQYLPDFGLTFLCIHTHHFTPSPGFSKAIRDLANDNDLCIVDWGRLCRVPTHSESSFRDWMAPYT